MIAEQRSLFEFRFSEHASIDVRFQWHASLVNNFKLPCTFRAFIIYQKSFRRESRDILLIA